MLVEVGSERYALRVVPTLDGVSGFVLGRSVVVADTGSVAANIARARELIRTLAVRGLSD